MSISRYFLSLLLLLCTISLLGQSVNIIALSKGSEMITTPPSYKEVTERNLFLKYSPGALFDETTSVWCSKNTQFPMTFVVELVEEYTLTNLVFNNQVEDYSGIETKDVRVEVSTLGPNAGFTLLGNYQLSKDRIHRETVPETNARWIRITILSNYGHESWVELAEFEAWGTPTNPNMETIAIDGQWKTNWQNINFNQKNSTFSGKYAYGNVKGSVSNGTIDRNIVYFRWKEGSLVGTAKLYMNKEGDRLSGIWQNSNNANDYGLWTMTRTDPKAIVYEDNHEGNGGAADVDIPDTEAPDVVEFEGEEIKVGETVVLDNVLFVRARAVLLPESLPQLGKLVELLEQNPSLKLDLGGHTDNQGSESLNIKLSEDRVQTVIRHLVKKGISEDRLTGKGYGPHQPLNDNSTEALRKLNRRVEFKLVK